MSKVTQESPHSSKAVLLAKKITDKADAILAPLDFEMDAMNWSPRYREIMWQAVIIAAHERMERAGGSTP